MGLFRIEEFFPALRHNRMVDANLVHSWSLGAWPADTLDFAKATMDLPPGDGGHAVDYEALPQYVSPYTHMCAGALAGIMEHCVMYPVDSVKTRMQSIRLASTYRGAWDGLRKMMATEGILRPVRGIQAVFVGAGPAHAMYFACYENVKTSLEARMGHNPVAHGLAGSAAAVFHDAVMNPAEVVKQRMQMFGSPYQSCTHCFRSILTTEGPRAFYRSYFTQLTMNIPFQGIHFVIYELMQDYMNPTRRYDPASHVVSGAAAGALAAAVTTPLDVCKTLLNTQELCALNRDTVVIRGLPQAMAAIYRCCGFRGYFQGLQARVIFQMPSTAISWSVYEFFKYFISKRRQEDHG